MRLLLDQGLPRSAADFMRDKGYDAVHVGEIGAQMADDAHILQMGRDEKRVVITLDADFHSLLALSGAASPSVIRIREEGMNGKALAGLIEAVIRQCKNDLDQGAVISVSGNRLRVRHLPIIR